MKLFIIRHAKAEDKDDFGKEGRPDSQRPLTDEGRTEFKKVAKALTKLMPKLDLIVTSPLVRAEQTAEILRSATKAEVIERSELGIPMKMDALLDWLDEISEKYESVAFVGHEPDLGKFVSYTLSGDKTSFAPMKKGGVAYVKFDYRVRPGLGQLKWFLSPSVILGLKEI